MQNLIDSYKNNSHLHHAYVVEGDTQTSYKNVCDFCTEELDFKIKANPHFIYEEYDKFLVDDARRIRELQMHKNKAGEKKIIVISFNFITTEAQNSLLKVLEEPTKGVHFFILTPSAHIFLDTIKSRVSFLSSGKNIEEQKTDFLSLDIKDRMKFITKLVQNIKDEKASKFDAIKLIRNLENVLHQKALRSLGDERLEYFKKIKKINKVADYLQDSSASVKQLLEYTAITI
jgi:DNA polymerase III delta prime subunit